MFEPVVKRGFGLPSGVFVDFTECVHARDYTPSDPRCKMIFG